MKISVCMATYNGGRYLPEQLESILCQLPSDAEIVIADDGSTDGTMQVVRNCNDSRIKLLPSAEHLGPVYNFERSLQAASGDLIFLADQDDRWLSGKVGSVVRAVEGGAALVVHDACFIDGVGRELSDLGSMWNKWPYHKGVVKNWLKNSYTGCCMAFTRQVLQYALPFPKSLPMHDQWIGLVAERKFAVTAISDKLIQYRIHEKNATHLTGGETKGSGNVKKGAVQKIKWRLDLLRALLVG